MTLYKPWSFNVASLIMYALAPGALAGILFNGGSDPNIIPVNSVLSVSSIIRLQSISDAIVFAVSKVTNSIRNLLNSKRSEVFTLPSGMTSPAYTTM